MMGLPIGLACILLLYFPHLHCKIISFSFAENRELLVPACVSTSIGVFVQVARGVRRVVWRVVTSGHLHGLSTACPEQHTSCTRRVAPLRPLNGGAVLVGRGCGTDLVATVAFIRDMRTSGGCLQTEGNFERIGVDFLAQFAGTPTPAKSFMARPVVDECRFGGRCGRQQTAERTEQNETSPFARLHALHASRSETDTKGSAQNTARTNGEQSPQEGGKSPARVRWARKVR